MKNYYSIGEMSKINNVSIQTLRYYDRIGLLKPSYINAENKYRYYTYEEIMMLDAIQYLKTLGMSLTEIQQKLENRNISNSLKMHEKQHAEIKKKITELQLLEKKVYKSIINLRECQKISKDTPPQIKYFPARYMLTINKETKTEEEYEVNIRELGNDLLDRYVYSIDYFGALLSEDNLFEKRYDNFVSIGVILDEKPKELKKNITILPDGNYACMYYFGYENDAAFEELLNYIHQNKYKVNGNTIEIYLIDTIETSEISDYITEIQIPILIEN